MNKKCNRWRVTWKVCVCLVMAACVSAWSVSLSSAAKDKVDYEALRKFSQVLRIVKQNYLKEMTDKELVELALKGMLEQLDIQSRYIDKEDFRALQEEAAGKAPAALGLELGRNRRGLEVVSPIDGTPASKAGIRAGDIIVSINGKSTRGMSLAKGVKQLRGSVGSKVTLEILRKGRGNPIKLTLKREKIVFPSLVAKELAGNILYVRLPVFTESTADDLRKRLEQAERQGKLKGLILDLRNNPGGLLDTAVKTANLFIEKGLIVYTEGRHKDQRMNFQASSDGPKFSLPIAVLINQGSVGGSEILAGALQEHGAAAVFGSVSYKKAGITTVIPLVDGSGLNLVTALYYSPKGRSYQEEGVVPDVDMTEEMEKAESDLRHGSLQHPRKAADLKSDAVVQKAVQWLKSGKSIKELNKR